MENRNFILDKLKSKPISIDEFNYDKLQAPPISAMFTPEDIYQLNQIAKSIKYAAKPQVKYQEIDKIMRRRGFVKFISGTNRVVYRPLEDNRFLVKVAYDAVGLGDNPREFRNQFIFKPFVCKVFEVTPCGTLGVFERVVPITSREEFYSVAKDIYEVTNNWFVGEYVLEDIGTKYFMNWGIRKGFGPVLIDFPYVYKLDGNKLYCNAPNPSSPTGCCEGTIDYDAGFNFLYCTKCGVKYKAKELAEAVKENNIIVKTEGDIKMKVVISGGSKNENKVVETGMYAGMAKNIPTSSINVSVKGGSSTNNEEKNTNNDDLKNQVEPTIRKSSYENKDKSFREFMDEAISNSSVPSPEPEEVTYEVSDNRSRKVESPIDFDESLIGNCKDETIKFPEDVTNPDYDEEFIEIFSPTIKFIENHHDEIKNNKLNVIDTLNSLFEVVVDIIENADDELKDKIVETVEDAFEYIIPINKKVVSIDKEETEDISEYRFVSLIKKANDVYTKLSDDQLRSINPDDFVSLETAKKLLTDLLFNNSYSTFDYYAATVVNTKDLFANVESSKIIVIIDKDGNYLTSDDGAIIAINVIDDRDFNNLSLVSQEWLKNEIDFRDSYNEENSNTTTIDIPVGVLAPGVNIELSSGDDCSPATEEGE